MVSDALTVLNRKRVFDYADKHHLPAIYESDPYVTDGGLMSYGADRKESITRAASLIDKIFKGGANALPVRDKSEDCQGHWSRDTGSGDRARRRRDRIAAVLLRCTLSPNGP
jgi:hypothetical protein